MAFRELVVVEQDDGSLLLGFDYESEGGTGKYICHIKEDGHATRYLGKMNVEKEDGSIDVADLYAEANLHEELLKLINLNKGE